MNLDRFADGFCQALAAELKRRRLLAKMSLTRLGEDAGLSQQMVSYMEKGVRTPTVGTLYRVCRVLGADVSEVVRAAEDSLVSDSRRK